MPTAKKAKCQFCGESRSLAGLFRHEGNCAANPNRQPEVSPQNLDVLRQVAKAGGHVDAREMGLARGQFPVKFFGVAITCLQRMEEEGWITREIEGKRFMRIEVTDAGRALLDANSKSKHRGQLHPGQSGKGETTRARILGAFNGAPLSIDDVRERTGIGKSAAWGHLSTLVKNGALERIQRGMYQKPGGSAIVVAPLPETDIIDVEVQPTNGRASYGSSPAAQIKRRLAVDASVARALDVLKADLRPDQWFQVESRKLVECVDSMRELISV